VTTQKQVAANRAHWDDLVPHHVASEFYDVDGFKAGRSSLKRIDVEGMGDVGGKRLLHLQCHFGLDTLSWARLGADVTGVDFSRQAIEAARAISRETGIAGRFLECDVYDAASVAEGPYDRIFTGIGALCWLPDLDRWAGVVSRLLEPGGVFYMRECHPLTFSFDESSDPVAPRFRYPYLTTGEHLRSEDAGSYAVRHAGVENRVSYEWSHDLGETLTALAGAGLRIEFLREHDVADWEPFPNMAPTEDGLWRLPESAPRIPLTYSVRAIREA
jgi:SAM-dependent methyltransferase